jgi:WS/DGAT/MGAT family acyltransferase
VALPEPAGDAELCELVGQILSEPLDRSRPLWQLALVEGLGGGRTALVAKMHHALVDDIATVDVSTVILDRTPEGLEIPSPEERAPAAGGLAARLDALTRIASAQLDLPRRLAREAVSRTADPRSYARQMHDAAAVVAELAHLRPQAPPTRLNQGIGRERRWAVARCRLDEVKAIGRAAGATLNDVLLTVVALMLSGPAGRRRARPRRGARPGLRPDRGGASR